MKVTQMNLIEKHVRKVNSSFGHYFVFIIMFSDTTTLRDNP